MAFDRVEIESHYLDGDSLKRRTFKFRPVEITDEVTSSPSSENSPRTTVRLVGCKSPYKEGCPNELVNVAQRLVENIRNCSGRFAIPIYRKSHEFHSFRISIHAYGYLTKIKARVAPACQKRILR